MTLDSNNTLNQNDFIDTFSNIRKALKKWNSEHYHENKRSADIATINDGSDPKQTTDRAVIASSIYKNFKEIRESIQKNRIDDVKKYESRLDAWVAKFTLHLIQFNFLGSCHSKAGAMTRYSLDTLTQIQQIYKELDDYYIYSSDQIPF